MSLRTYSRRALSQRPGRTILTVLSIVIGVTAVVAVTILTETTRGAYKLMFETVTGRASLEVVPEGGASFKQDILAAVEKVPGVQAAAPLVQRPSVLYFGEQRVRLQLMGIDPERDPAVRDYALVAGKPLYSGDQLLLDEAFAKHLKIKVNDQVRLLTKRGVKPITVVGLLKPQGSGGMQQSALVFLPLKRAQYYFNGRGRTTEIDSIQIVLKDEDQKAEVQAAIATVLPEGVTVRPPASNTRVMSETLMSSEQGLKMASIFSLLLSAFIILNTFMMNVGERRRHLAIMRAIGATASQMSWMLLRESLLLGVLGTVLGIGAGLGVAYTLNDTLTRVLEVNLPQANTETLTRALSWAVVFGIGMSVLGALVPALMARWVSPLEGMSRVSKSDIGSRGPMAIALTVLGVLLVAVSVGLITAGILGYVNSDVPVYTIIPLYLGMVMLVPLVLAPMSTAVAALLRPLVKIEGALALKQILRHRGRSTLTVGVLFIAASAGVGLASAIIDNVEDVQNWVRTAVIGDFFVRAMMPDMATGTSADLPETLEAEITALPRIKHLDRISFLEGQVGETAAIVIARQFDQPGKLPFDLQEGDEDKLREQLYDGQVVLASVIAKRLEKHAGDQIELETPDGKKQLRIAGIANDYLVGGLGIYIQRDVAIKLLELEGVDGYVVRADDADLPALKAELQQLVDKHGVLLQSNADISRTVNRIVSAVDWSLWVLVYLGFVVAAFGVVNTLTMNVLEQTRELGLLRIVAMTKSQVRRTILTQALIIGGVGLVPGVLSGVAVAYLMNLAMGPAFGHPIEFGFHPWLLVGALFGSLLITALDAFLPARRAASINVVDALHYE